MVIKRHVVELEKRNNKGRKNYIKDFLRDLIIPYRLQKFRGFLRTGENIIIDYPFFEKIPAEAKKIFLSAHYDKVFTSPGANDNASGVAIILEFLSKLGKTNPQNIYIRIVFFDLEEGPPFLAGSKNYVKKFGFQDIDRVYNLDMVGMGDILMLWLDKKEDGLAPWFDSLVKNAGKFGMTVVREPARLNFGFGIVFQSDHVSFIQGGFSRACSLTVIPEEDKIFKEILEKRELSHFVFSLLRYIFTKRGDFPKILRHYHFGNDRSDFVEEDTLAKILNIVWEAVFGNSR